MSSRPPVAFANFSSINNPTIVTPRRLAIAPTTAAYALASAGERLALRYAGATATAVLDGHGEVEVAVDGERTAVLRLEGPRLYELHETNHHEEHDLELRFREATRAYAFSFAAGIA